MPLTACPAERDDARHEVAAAAPLRERLARARDARVRVEHVARDLERERGAQDQRVRDARPCRRPRAPRADAAAFVAASPPRRSSSEHSGRP